MMVGKIVKVMEYLCVQDVIEITTIKKSGNPIEYLSFEKKTKKKSFETREFFLKLKKKKRVYNVSFMGVA